MSKRKPRARRTSSAAKNSCCPIIYTKCDRPKVKAVAKALGGLGSVVFPWETSGKGRSAEKSAAAFERLGPTAVERSIEAAAASASRKEGVKAQRIMCTIRVGASTRRVNVVDLKAAIKRISAAQEKRRCKPVIKGMK